MTGKVELMLAHDRQNNDQDGRRGEPVRLDAWVAASQPQLGPARRRVLLAVAELSKNGEWVSSSEVKAISGGQRQPVNRHLRALELDGLVTLQFQSKGMPLYVKATPAGLRAVGLRGPLRTPEPVPSPAAVPPAAAPTPEASPAEAIAPAAPGRLERFVSSFYQALQPHLVGLSYTDFRRLLVANLTAALGRGARPDSPTPYAQPPAPAASDPGQAFKTAIQQTIQDALGRQPAPAGPQTVVVSQASAGYSQAPRPESLPLRFRAETTEPPVLNTAETALEERLAQSCNSEHRQAAWWQRSKDFSDVWDRVRRWRLGSLSTTFTSFGPRWQHPDWDAFNRARRQADARGARYLDWIEAQFDRLNNRVAPADLHGDEAVAAWQNRMRQTGGAVQGGGELPPPPYTPESFNIHNPEHAAYAEEVMEQICSLAQRVFGDDSDGPVRLLSQAVQSGNLPLAALELRPQWRDSVVAALRPQGPSTGGGQALMVAGGGSTRPAVII